MQNRRYRDIEKHSYTSTQLNRSLERPLSWGVGDFPRTPIDTKTRSLRDVSGHSKRTHEADLYLSCWTELFWIAYFNCASSARGLDVEGDPLGLVKDAPAELVPMEMLFILGVILVTLWFKAQATRGMPYTGKPNCYRMDFDLVPVLVALNDAHCHCEFKPQSDEAV